MLLQLNVVVEAVTAFALVGAVALELKNLRIII
jgi:hypothetical protein